MLACRLALSKTWKSSTDDDDSYDFSQVPFFLAKLRAGDDLVMGDRFKGGIALKAMPPLHKYLGNPVLTQIGHILQIAMRQPSLWASRIQQSLLPADGTADNGNGICNRDGSQGDPPGNACF
jgi:hypothetical protein